MLKNSLLSSWLDLLFFCGNQGVSRKGIDLHLQEIKMDLSRRNENVIGVFVSGSETKQFCWIPKETISEVERLGQMEDLTISIITFKEKKISFHFSKIDFVLTISPSEL